MTKVTHLQILDLHEAVRAVTVEGKSYEDICEKIAITDITLAKRRRKRETPEDDSDSRQAVFSLSKAKNASINYWYLCSDYYEEYFDNDFNFYTGEVESPDQDSEPDNTNVGKHSIVRFPCNTRCYLPRQFITQTVMPRMRMKTLWTSCHLPSIAT